MSPEPVLPLASKKLPMRRLAWLTGAMFLICVIYWQHIAFLMFRSGISGRAHIGSVEIALSGTWFPLYSSDSLFADLLGVSRPPNSLYLFNLNWLSPRLGSSMVLRDLGENEIQIFLSGPTCGIESTRWGNLTRICTGRPGDDIFIDQKTRTALFVSNDAHLNDVISIERK